MDLNNRRIGKDATKPRALGLLGHSACTGKVVFLKNIQTIHVSQWIKKVGGDSSSRTHAVYKMWS